MKLKCPFFVGIAGSGMSAIAQYLAMAGNDVSGSDRALDNNMLSGSLTPLLELGIHLFPQNGSGITPRTTCVVYSTAVEKDNPEIQKAESLRIPLLHRSEVLSFLASEKKSIAVAGTSGKSTVTAMVYQILEAARLKPSIITGANLISLQQNGLQGNAKAGTGEWLVFEADESDGTLDRYHPFMGVVLNIEKDHKEIDHLVLHFKTFCQNIHNAVILNREDDNCVNLSRILSDKEGVFFSSKGIQTETESFALSNPVYKDWNTCFDLNQTSFSLSVPGHHNVMNAMAAVALCLQLNIPLEICSRGLKQYSGIQRRHTLVGQKNGITVIDDFAHNPIKVAACLKTVKSMEAAALSGSRIIAIFHPHGFGPMKLFRKELVNAFLQVLSDKDLLLMPEIYYAGGTADRSISSRDIINDICSIKPLGRYFSTKNELLKELESILRPGDIVVNMGARDPGLSEFAYQILTLASKISH